MIMLTKTQLAMLEKRKDPEEWERLDSKKRKYIDFTFRRYVERQFDSLIHLLQIIDILPDDQIRAVLTPQKVANLLKVVERVVEILPPVEVKSIPIEGGEKEGSMRFVTYRQYEVDFGSKIEGLKKAEPRVYVTCPASEDEIEYWNMFLFSKDYFFQHISKDHLENPPKCTSKALNQDILPKLNKIANQRGVFCTIKAINNFVGDLGRKISNKEAATQFDRSDN